MQAGAGSAAGAFTLSPSSQGRGLVAFGLVYDAAAKRLKSPRIIGVGFSIGTGVAAQLSAKRKLLLSWGCTG